MGLEQLRYCDLCGSTVDERAGKLSVPSVRREAPTPDNDLVMMTVGGLIRSFGGGESQEVFDICADCCRSLLTHAYQRRLAAKAKIEQELRQKQATVDAELFLREG